MKVILIAGGTGLIGQRLSEQLEARGYQVRLLSRTPGKKANREAFAWNPAKNEIDPKALEGVYGVINLAGAGIADKRWTDARKKLIIDSRVEGTHLLAKTLRALASPPAAYVAASAMGIYGDRGDEWLDEESTTGTGFLSESTLAWEKSVQAVEQTSVRTVRLRIGIVLSMQGGALEKMLLPSKFRLATYFGSGRQWYSWIHIDDLCRMFVFALENEALHGAYNAVAPYPAPNKQFTEAIGQAMDKPGLPVPAPAFGLRLVLGEMADVILNSTRVRAEKIQKAGFDFEYPQLEPALRDILQREV